MTISLDNILYHLLDGAQEDLSPVFRRVLDEIFAKFDADRDEMLSIAELQAFAEFSNGAPFDDASLEELRETLDFDEAADALTKRGFFDLYYMQTVSEPAETLRDLKKHGFGALLKELSDQEIPEGAELLFARGENDGVFGEDDLAEERDCEQPVVGEESRPVEDDADSADKEPATSEPSTRVGR